MKVCGKYSECELYVVSVEYEYAREDDIEWSELPGNCGTEKLDSMFVKRQINIELDNSEYEELRAIKDKLKELSYYEDFCSFDWKQYASDFYMKLCQLIADSNKEEFQIRTIVVNK